MAINFDALYRQAQRDLEEQDIIGGKSATPQLDKLMQAWGAGKEQREWKERKNLQRQQIMAELSRGTSMTFNEKDLKIKKERFQNYYNKYKGNMDESTLEMGQFMLDDFDMQTEKNKDWNFLLADGERLQKELSYDMQNIGVDAEGNQRTLDENDYKIIKEMQKEWIDHTKKIKTNFADRLELKPFQHINTELTNAKNINDFLLVEAREDNLIDDMELQAYIDAWESFNYAPVEKYENDQKAGKTAAITFNTNELLTGAKRYKDLYNFYVNDSVIPYKDQQTGTTINLTHEQMKRQVGGDKILRGLLAEFNSLPQELRNLNNTNIKLSKTDFLRTADLTLHDIPPDVQDQILAGEKTILDVPQVQETVAGPKGRAEKVKEAAGISDADVSAIKTLGGGLAIVGAAHQAENIAKIGAKTVDVTVKAGKYIHKLTKLSPSQITEFLESDKVKGTLEKLGKYEKSIKKGQNKKQVQKLINETKNKSVKYWSKRFGAKPDVIAKLYKTGTTGKWNLWKAKAGLPKALKRTGTRYAIGSILTDALGFEFEGATRIGVDIGTGYAMEKMTTKKFFPALMKIIKSPKGQQYLLNYMSKKAVTKIGTAAVAGGGWFSLATSLIGAGLVTKDIMNIVKNWNPEEGEE